ncbi:MAG: UbiA family prenyltransferase [Actinomycetota bacterium]|nr:UbiA family prenyltransferase [Actinomycetota bacterium]
MIARYARLSLDMLRYRVAAMIWTFLLLGAASFDGLASLDARYAWAALALAGTYVAATTVNDIADRDIDLVNHPRDRGRPLVTGAATVGDLVAVHAVGATVALLSAAVVGRAASAIVVASLLVGYVYSIGPIRLSYRTYLAPLALAVAYVVMPFSLGLVVAGADGIRGDEALLAAALYALFLARITLKDFRDREGDARYGKPTLLLRFGKSATCVVSFTALVAGNVMLVLALRPALLLGIVLEGFVAAIAAMLHTLWRAGDARSEQVAIGLGAQLGNGLLLLVLGWLALGGRGATDAERGLFAATITVLFASNWLVLRSRPDEAVIGYKG